MKLHIGPVNELFDGKRLLLFAYVNDGSARVKSVYPMGCYKPGIKPAVVIGKSWRGDKVEHLALSRRSWLFPGGKLHYWLSRKLHTSWICLIGVGEFSPVYFWTP